MEANLNLHSAMNGYFANFDNQNEDHVIMNKPIIDRRDLMNRVDGDLTLLNLLIDIFINKHPMILERIQEAIDSKNSQKLMQSSHILKSMISNFSAKSAEEAASVMEEQGRIENFDQIENNFNRLLNELSEMLDALAELKQEINKK